MCLFFMEGWGSRNIVSCFWLYWEALEGDRKYNVAMVETYVTYSPNKDWIVLFCHDLWVINYKIQYVVSASNISHVNKLEEQHNFQAVRKT